MIQYMLINANYIRAFFCRFVNGMVYYGVSFSSPFVGGNMYLNFFITSTIALVAYPALAWGCNRLATSDKVSRALFDSLLLSCLFFSLIAENVVSTELTATVVVSFPLSMFYSSMSPYIQVTKWSASSYSGLAARKQYAVVFSSLPLDLLDLFCSLYSTTETIKVDISYQNTYSFLVRTKG